MVQDWQHNSYPGDRVFIFHLFHWFIAPSKCSETVGGGTTMTTDADAPPSYSDVVKEQQPEAFGVLPDQLDQSPLMIQPVPQPGALIQLVPYMVRVHVNEAHFTYTVYSTELRCINIMLQNCIPGVYLWGHQP